MKKTFTLIMALTNLALIAQTRIYISGRNSHSIEMYDLQGNHLGEFVEGREGGLDRPQDLFFHPKTGELLVTGFNNNAIKAFDPVTGEFLRDFSKGRVLTRPTKMKIGPDSLIYVTSWASGNFNKVMRFDLNGNFVDDFTSMGVPFGCELDWDKNGNLLVVTFGNGNNGLVQQFDTAGNFVQTFINSNNLSGPVNIWKYGTSEWLVADWTDGQVNRFDSTGVLLGTFVSGMTNIEGYAYDSLSRLYLCDWEQDEILRFQSDGTYDKIFIPSGTVDAPNAILFGPAPGSTNTHLREEIPPLGQAYPNPFWEQLTLEHPKMNESSTLLEVTNNQGQLILTERPESNDEICTLNTENWSTCTYYIRLKVDGELVKTFKVVKRKP